MIKYLINKIKDKFLKKNKPKFKHGYNFRNNGHIDSLNPQQLQEKYLNCETIYTNPLFLLSNQNHHQNL